MPTDTFRRRFDTPRSPQECWEVLTDVDRVASWVPIVHDVVTVAPLRRYTAVLEDRVGPFRLRADLELQVTRLEPGQSIAFRAEGQDRQVGSRLVVEALMTLTGGATDATAVDLAGSYSVEGRVATLGASVIRHKAEAIIAQFSGRAEEELSA